MKLKSKTPRATGGPSPDTYYLGRWPSAMSLPISQARPEDPKPDLALNLPDTHMLFVDGKFYQLYTRMPDGVIVAWATCSACSRHVTMCGCSRGFSVLRSVEYIHDKTTADMAGEDWSLHHPQYNGSLRDLRRASSRLARPTRERVHTTTTPKPQHLPLVAAASEGAVAKKLKLKRLDQFSADADVSALVEEKIKVTKTLKIKRK